MILKISDKINEESLDKLVTFYNDVNRVNDEKALIYLSSGGGDTAIMECMLDIINKHAHKTTIYAYDTIASCAFDLFFKVKCHVVLVQGCIGVYHQTTINICTNEYLKAASKQDSFNKELIQSYKESTLKMCENLRFTNAEINKIKRGEDVWFLPSRMRELLQNSNEYSHEITINQFYKIVNT